MRAELIRIHNFRSFIDAEIRLSPYGLLVGANNSGKSNIIEAIKVFYEKENAKFDESRDFPKFDTIDQESWIEITFRPSPEEFATLKEEYKQRDDTFTVRKFLKTKQRGSDGKPKNGIYAYIDGKLSDDHFYGAKNVQQGKFGDIIYIPAVSKLDEHTKLTGPSVLRELINSVCKKVIAGSDCYLELSTAFDKFNEIIKDEETPDGVSLTDLQTDISKELMDWGTDFVLDFNTIAPDDMVKSLIKYKIWDKGLDRDLDPAYYGQGFQRHLIYTLIRLSAQYTSSSVVNGRDFSPSLTWLLFEEPEAFLHPNQIEKLNDSLCLLSGADGNQVLITTHNPQFVSKSIKNISALARLRKDGVESKIGQISTGQLDKILETNQECLSCWKKAEIKIDDEDMKLDMESIKYALWLNPLRSAAFFANKVLLVEGPTETALLGHMIDNGRIKCLAEGVFILDTIGKYNIHRFMNLLGALGINHAILYDNDGGNSKQSAVHETIKASQNAFTKGIDQFDQDLETFLGIPPISKGLIHRKPQHVMYHLAQGKITEKKLSALADKVEVLLFGTPVKVISAEIDELAESTPVSDLTGIETIQIDTDKSSK